MLREICAWPIKKPPSRQPERAKNTSIAHPGGQVDAKISLSG
jgi:hypothetical protein